MSAKLNNDNVYVAKHLVSHHVGNNTIDVYPEITNEMTLADKANAFSMNKTLSSHWKISVINNTFANVGIYTGAAR